MPAMPATPSTRQPLVRSAALTHFTEVAVQCGLDPRALVADVGLPARCLAEPDLKVPAWGVGRLLELAAARAGEPAFGVRMAEQRRLSNLGPLGLLVRDEPTLGSALEALVRHIHLHNEALALRVERSGGLVLIRQELVGEAGQPLTQAIELALGVTYRVLALFLGAQWQPRLVCFTHRAPASLAAHQRLFGPRVEFGHEFNGIVCNAQDLDAPNPGADPVMAQYTRALLEGRVAATVSMVDRVRQMAVLLLPRGHCRVDVVAQGLGVDRRTLARRLAAQGTSFSALVDELRSDLLARYLDEGTRALGDIALLLGFSAPSAFSRWHRQRFGVAPRQVSTVRAGSRWR